MKAETKNILALVIFCIAMAALESAVVVYLRALYYPGRFTVAFKIIDQQIVLIEVVREFATLLMLCGIAYITGKSFQKRIACFLISFAVWDIFYYVWLKVFIDWPETLFDWDILFLIPITWLGPVIAPIICSLLMLTLGALLIRSKNLNLSDPIIYICLGIGCIFFLGTFMQDYFMILVNTETLSSYPNLMNNKRFVTTASNYIPQSFNWRIFFGGVLMVCIAMYRMAKMNGGIRTDVN